MTENQDLTAFVTTFYVKPIIEIFKRAGVDMWWNTDSEPFIIENKGENVFEISIRVKSNSIEYIAMAKENCENTVLKNVEHVIIQNHIYSTNMFVIEDIYIRLKIN